MCSEHETDEYPHDDRNDTCPGPGIKCVCWDLSRETVQMDEEDER